MTGYKPGEIILTEMIFAEKNVKKKRPALILSTPAYNRNRHDVIIAAITSNVTRVLYGDTLLKDWKQSGLLFPSLVAGIIQTIKRDMIIRRLGHLTERDFKKVRTNLKKSSVFL